MKENDHYIQGIFEANERVISEIYSSFFNKTLSFVLRNNGQEVDAEDVFQKALMQISARIKTKRLTTLHSSFEAYLFTACKNLWRRELNKNKKTRVTNEGVHELVSEEHDMAYALLEQERWELFREKLDNLSDNCKVVVELFLKKVSYSDIVLKFGYSSETVARQRVFKCKAKLIQLIKGDDRFNILT